ncbi:MAG TPA: DUF1049 domain-containing protein [Cyanobacteria bacterium UBA11370]|nr:DUF1049 domain-containing protein [Cyanobacteria bacterium UBA11370]HBY75611.1 DUF1049 domain-containing protein [Cyanobacteria bacterium UBA11148]
MRQINFLIIFAVCLALVLFSMENTEPVVIRIIDGVEIEAPLAIELIFAMGFGAVLAWIFSVWTRLTRTLESRQVLREIRSKDERIQELEQDVERYKAEIEVEPEPLSSSEAITEVAMVE